MKARLLLFSLLVFTLALTTVVPASAVVEEAKNAALPKGPSAPKPAGIERLAGIVSKIDPLILDKEFMAGFVKKYGKFMTEHIMGLADRMGVEIAGVEAGETVLSVFVKVSTEEGYAELEKVLSDIGGTPVKTYKMGFVLVALPSTSYEDFLRKVARIANLDIVEGVYLNDVKNITMLDTTVMTGALAVWQNLGYTGSGIRVAVLDTGIDPNHPDLQGALVAWVDFINGYTTPYDDHGHGTHVSGTIAGRGVVPWGYGERVWHAPTYNDASEYNYPGSANLTFLIDVSAAAGAAVNVSWWHLYAIETNYDYGFVYYRFLDVNMTPLTDWAELASYTGMQTDLTQELYTLTVPAGAAFMALSFIYAPDSSYQWLGWFIDNITVSANGTVLFFDDAEAPSPAVVEAYLWHRALSSMKGMAPEAGIMMAKVCSATGGCPDSAILSGIEWAVLGPDGQPGTGDEAHIISMSLGGPANTYDELAQAVDWAAENGVVPVIAAGNEGPDYFTVASPGIAHSAITVAAATKLNTIAWFSSKGPSPVDLWTKPDIAAPGRYIISAVPVGSEAWPGWPYEPWSGTSMATPHVSGLAALVREAHPAWGPEEVKAAIVSTATPLTPSSYAPAASVDPFTQGGGMINAVAAVTADFLPVPAILSFQEIGTGFSKAVNVSLRDYSGLDRNVTVVDVKLYAIDPSSGSVVSDVSDWVVSPALGAAYTVPANGETVMTVEIAVPSNWYQSVFLGGYILLQVDGRIYKVTIGATVAAPVKIYGYVYDAATGTPVANATVEAYSPDFTTLYAANVSGPDGYYEIYVPAYTDVRVTAGKEGYYKYISGAFKAESDTYMNIYITPRYGYNDAHVLVVRDTQYGEMEGSSYAPDVTWFLALNGTHGTVMRLWDNAYQGVAADAILSGDFPIVAWLAGGTWYAVDDPLDALALIYFVDNVTGTAKGVILGGGDIGWSHGGDALMQKVAHAVFVYDLSPATWYLATELSPVTCGVAPGTVIAVDAGSTPGYGYPDAVMPVRGGYTAAYWYDLVLMGYGYYAGIVVYPATGEEPVRTVYFAYPTAALEEPYRSLFANNTLAWMLGIVDNVPPVFTADTLQLRVVAEGGSYVLKVPVDKFVDESGIKAYYVYIYDEYGNVVYSGYYENVAGPAISIDLTALGLPMYEKYKVEVVAIDNGCNRAEAEGMFYYLPPSNVGEAETGTGNFTAALEAVDAVVSVVSNGTTVVQITKITPEALNVTPLPLRGLSYYDLWVGEEPAGATQQIVVTFDIGPLPHYLWRLMPQPLWWNGTGWEPFSNYTIDPVTHTVTVVVTEATRPSIADLTGTPIVLGYYSTYVGGEVAGADAALQTPLHVAAMVAAALLGLGIVALVARRQV